MATRFRKTRKMRGEICMGYGRVGKHRKHPSGRGNAGGMHHHRIMMDKYHPGYFGKVGMRHFHLKRATEYCPALNLDQLWANLPEEVKTAAEQAKGTGKAPVVDLTSMGYFKLLGRGHIPAYPLVIKARFVSKKVCIVSL